MTQHANVGIGNNFRGGEETAAAQKPIRRQRHAIGPANRQHLSLRDKIGQPIGRCALYIHIQHGAIPPDFALATHRHYDPLYQRHRLRHLQTIFK